MPGHRPFRRSPPADLEAKFVIPVGPPHTVEMRILPPHLRTYLAAQGLFALLAVGLVLLVRRRP